MSRNWRTALALATLACAAPCGGAELGRLFFSPVERQQLEATRQGGVGPSSPAAPQSGMAVTPAPPALSMQPSVAAALQAPMDPAPAGTLEQQLSQLQSMQEASQELMRARYAQPTARSSSRPVLSGTTVPPAPPPLAPVAMVPAATLGSAQNVAPQASSGIEFNGVLRSRKGVIMLWLDQQPGMPSSGTLSTGGAWTPSLLSGRQLQLRPGQRYEQQSGRIKDVHE